MAGTTDARQVAHMGTLPRASSAPPAAISPDHSPLHQMERISRVKNRVLESGSHGSVGGEDGNVLAYPAVVPTIGFKLLYAFVIVRLARLPVDRRDLVRINVTTHPTA